MSVDLSNVVNASGSQFTINAAAINLGNVTDLSHGSVTLTGGGTTNLSKASNIDGASFFVSGGVTLALPAATNYNHAATANDQYRTFQASGTGSLLDLGNLTSITNGTAYDSNIVIEALNGGTVDLHSVSQMSDGSGGDVRYRAISVTADGPASVVNLANLVSLRDDYANGDGTDEARFSSLNPKNGGVIQAPNLTTLVGVALTIDGQESLPVSQITSMTNGRVVVSNTPESFTALTNASGTQFIINGVSVDLSNVVNASGSQFTINAAAINLGNVTDLSHGSVTLTGGGTANLSKASNIDGASFFVSGGVTLALPAATNYNHAATANDQYRTFQASGTGSLLDLGNLTSITNGTAYDSNIVIEALNGGTVDLHSVSQMSDGSGGDIRYRAISVTADGPASVVNLANLVSLRDDYANGDGTDEARFSSLNPKNGGVIQAPNLTTLVGVALTIDGQESLPVSQITSMTNGRVVVSNTPESFTALTNASGTQFIINGVSVDLSNVVNASGSQFTINAAAINLGNVTDLSHGSVTLTGGGTANLSKASNIDGASFFVSGGVTLALPAATNYNHAATANDQYRTFQASGTGSLLDLGNLTSITNGTAYDSNIMIEALNGETVDLHNVSQMMDGSGGDARYRAISVTADGPSSLIKLPSLAFFSDAYSGSTSGENTYSSLTADNSGKIQVNNPFLQGVLTTVADGGVLQGSAMIGTASLLQGGNLGVITGDIVNFGTVAPGPMAGKLTILGGFTQATSGKLAIEIGGSAPGFNFDQLNVTGSVSLDGELDLIPLNGYDPALDSQFRVLPYASRAGVFSLLVGADISTGKHLNASYDSDGLYLVVAAD